ncbi:arylsulfatase [Pontibacter sp. G13]|uniref:arylsulfatase n=1 Tax=Pontibacter sp. G13 TaxID=3074898 RepID=UPI00288AB818|nr:arylsulfatase [Pontibacter sp. G13]WNJ19090.1 arylsulfatase [Pontibacter sp. G13]
MIRYSLRCWMWLFLMGLPVYQLSAQTRPNVVLISADDLGWSDLGCYGSEIQTPHLDKLAQEGMRFTDFHNTSKCFPSRASLLTGVYAQDCGYAERYHQPIRHAVTLGEVLRASGYSTYWSGKHHGKENPITRGFDRYYGLKDGACNHFNPGARRPGEAQPAQKSAKRAWCIDSILYRGYTPEDRDFYTTDYFTHAAIEHVQEASQRDQPFFLYLAYTAPHDPLMAWPEDIAKYQGEYDQGYEAIREARYRKQLDMGLLSENHQLSEATFLPWDQLSPEAQAFEARKMEVYAAMIDRMDQNIGRLLNELERLNLLDNTLILFVSDNGASAQVVNLDNDHEEGEIGGIDRWVSLGPDWANVSNTPFRFFKTYSFEGGINTPMIAWWPGRIQAQSFSDFPGHFIDIMPTLVELSEATYPTRFNDQEITPMRGVSLLPALSGKPLERAQPIFWEWKQGRAVRLGDWKIVAQGTNSPWELYHLGNDPTETQNLAAKHPEKVRELDALFQAWQASSIE